jgi:flagellar motor switch protein FliG
MQETQGLRLLAPDEEQTILDYLASSYPQKAATRRAALPAQQMPSNPYEAED